MERVRSVLESNESELNDIGNQTKVDIYHFYKTEQLIFLWVLFIFIVIGNCCVLAAIQLSPTGRRSRINFFITHLAVADLLAGLVNVLTDIMWKTTIEWHAGNVLCKIVRFLQALVTFASTFVLVSLSLDRLDAVAWPLHFSTSSSRARLLISTVWVLSACFSVPMLFITNENSIEDTLQCWIYLPEKWHWKLYLTMLSVALFIIPALIITICYAVIIHVIWSQGKVLQTATEMKSANTKSDSHDEKMHLKVTINTHSQSTRGVIPKAKIRTVKMTLIIVIVFACCWSPYFIYDLLDVYGHIPKNQNTIRIATFIQSLAPLNSAANPIIYGIFSTRICRNLRNVPLFNWVFCGRKADSTPSNWKSSARTTSTFDQSKMFDSPTQQRHQFNSSRRESPLAEQHRPSTKGKDLTLKHLVVRFNKKSSSVRHDLGNPDLL